MAHEKTRYKAVIADQTYTIIGQESKQHMDMVTKLINEQLAELKELSPQLDNEQAAILLAVNAFSDQLKRQEKNLNLIKEVTELKQKMVRFTEMENRIKRIEAIENEARAVLKENGSDHEIKNHVEAQQILNEKRKGQIKQRSSN
ncbi:MULTISPECIES: cell division protein ZapA [Enterococcus]|uniref:Cell division protein ZapA n=1 Tax=Enterococcus mundtii TaxID=53346 RepID=A0A1A6GA52_ENTMU|nr:MULTISPECIES: cell division protein ZapA [Enterococcus]MBE6171489.1 cell division protein ZapA [Enterococcus faecium]EOH63734.1 cell division protein ZapA [Enterococcus mundtii ATCC 882]EOU13285.1 cell division protein ZapA [Enterococcus mundtii ATCC 882]MBE9909750.1 cell division protein ZapA [Enterococcus mundtii]MBO1084782.1 cell division protein ZapA [Enterococcus mundtii]